MVTSPVSENAHSLPSDEVISLLGTDPVQGLTPSEAGDRLDTFGRNVLPVAPPQHPFRLLARQFRSVLVIILLLAAGVNLAFWILERDQGIPYDTIVIMAIVVANAALGFFQEYRAEKSLQKLQALTRPRAAVIRDGQQISIAGSELVPGDMLLLGTGDSILADARIYTANSLEVNESALTGESAAVLKLPELVDEDAPLADRTSMVYAGTQIAAGRGLAAVTITGSDTEMGKIAAMLISSPRQDTPLQENLEQLGKRLGVIILLVALVISVSGLLISGASSENVLNLLLFGVALAVAAIPEGLPAVVTGSLALGTQRMARRNAIVRHLHAVEVLGSTSAICSDKTGTLTAGEMMVRQVAVHSGEVTVVGNGYSPQGGEITGTRPAIEEATALAMSAVICNDASIHEEKNGLWRPVGTPTEAALVTLAARFGIDYGYIRPRNRRLSEEPFSSERKRMSVITSAGGGGAVLHTKGAPEMILPLCTHILTADGIIELSQELRRHFVDAASRMAANALRSLAVARRQVDAGACSSITTCEKDMVFLGLTGMADPPRPEAAASIRECRSAGIEVFMITGDHLATAKAIAAELGIIGGAMSGAEIEKATDEELTRRVEDTRIFARVSPGHKVRIVTALKANGHTVAVTGDGVNDAPALKRAHIGVAMGQTGTDVAREAADMVLADDNFATIVAAVEEGRAIYTNIRKFLGFLLSANAGLVLTLFLAVVFANQLGLIVDGQLFLPLLAVQILWINLVTNGPPALALGVEPKHPDAMLQPPRPRDEPVINRQILVYILLIGFVAALGGVLILNGYFPGGFLTIRPKVYNIEYPRTMAFVTLTLFQLFASINFRHFRGSSLTRLWGNPWLLAALALSGSMMVAVVHLPVLHVAFHTVPLKLSDWLIAVAVASTVLWAVEIYKAVIRWTGRRAENLPLG